MIDEQEYNWKEIRDERARRARLNHKQARSGRNVPRDKPDLSKPEVAYGYKHADRCKTVERLSPYEVEQRRIALVAQANAKQAEHSNTQTKSVERGKSAANAS